MNRSNRNLIRQNKAQVIKVHDNDNSIRIFDYHYLRPGDYRYFFSILTFLEPKTNRLMVNEGEKYVPMETHHLSLLFNISKKSVERIVRFFYWKNVFCVLQLWSHSEIYVNPNIAIRGNEVYDYVYSFFSDKPLSSFTERMMYEKFKTTKEIYPSDYVDFKKSEKILNFENFDKRMKEFIEEQSKRKDIQTQRILEKMSPHLNKNKNKAKLKGK